MSESLSESLSETITIRDLGARGDGIAEDGTIVPYALPGERVTVQREGRRAELLAVEQASADRVEPFCPTSYAAAAAAPSTSPGRPSSPGSGVSSRRPCRRPGSP